MKDHLSIPLAFLLPTLLLVMGVAQMPLLTLGQHLEEPTNITMLEKGWTVAGKVKTVHGEPVRNAVVTNAPAATP